MQRTEVRIVAGKLRGRKVGCVVTPELRPTPQMVREAYFSILGNAIPDRPFFDVFAGTGVLGMEAISRGASGAVFVERDPRLAREIEGYLERFGVRDRGQVVRADAYRWAERWVPPPGPVNVFLSPPFADLTGRLETFFELVRRLMEKAPLQSVLVIQAEEGFPAEGLPDAQTWELRKYGRNHLLIWVKEGSAEATAPDARG